MDILSDIDSFFPATAAVCRNAVAITCIKTENYCIISNAQIFNPKGGPLMIRFLIDQFRNAPGPLKKPRILAADLAEEILDLAEHFLKRGDSGSTVSNPFGSVSSSSASPAPDAQTSASSTSAASPVVSSAAEKPAASEPKAAAVLDPRLRDAIGIPTNIRKQEFKVLAILWDAWQKKVGALSAKAISKRGEDELNVPIRHENVRKVIRMRLENYVKVHAQGVGNGTVYNYELSEAGAEYFESTYLK